MKHIPRIYTSSLLDSDLSIALDQQSEHHLSNVMRIKDGEIIHLFNEKSGEWMAKCIKTKKASQYMCLSKVKDYVHTDGFEIVFAIVHPQKTHLILEKCTELGCAAFYPIVTQYTQHREFNVEKAKRTVINAVEQCGRIDIPAINNALSLERFLAEWNNCKTILVGDLCDQSINDLGDFHCFMVGPEGGFSEKERKMLERCHVIKRAQICKNILRTETAAIAFGSIWSSFR